jgi:hypothetical protein
LDREAGVKEDQFAIKAAIIFITIQNGKNHLYFNNIGGIARWRRGFGANIGAGRNKY